MNKKNRKKIEPLETFSTFSNSNILGPILVNSPDSITGWNYQKNDIADLFTEKPSSFILPENKNIKCPDKPSRRPLTANILPNTETLFPKNPQSKDIKRLKINTKTDFREQRRLLTPELENLEWSNFSFKERSPSSSKERNKGEELEKEKYIIEERGDSLLADNYSILKTDPGKFASKKDKDQKQKMINNPFLNKIAGYMERLKNNNRQQNDDKKKMIKNSLLYTNSSVKRKQISHSFNNANLSFGRRTFMGISMFTATANTPVTKEIIPTTLSTIASPRRNSIPTQIYNEQQQSRNEKPLQYHGHRANSLGNDRQITEMLEIRKPLIIPERKLSLSKPKMSFAKEDKHFAPPMRLKRTNDESTINKYIYKNEIRSKSISYNPSKDLKKKKFKDIRILRPMQKENSNIHDDKNKHIKDQQLKKLEITGERWNRLKL